MGIRVEYNKNWCNVDQICKVRQEKENGGGGAEGGVRGFRLPFVKKEFWLFHKIKSTKKREKQNPKKKKKKKLVNPTVPYRAARSTWWNSINQLNCFFHIYLLKVREKHVNEIDGQARLWLETGRDSCLVYRWVPLLHKPPTFQICSPVTMLPVYWWDPVTCSFYTSRFCSCLPCANKPLRRLPK